MDDCVVDTSAVVAVLREEPGGEYVYQHQLSARLLLSSVNLAESITALINHGLAHDDAVRSVGGLVLTIVAFDAAQAIEAARLRPITRAWGLSLGDRACLALAGLRSLPVVTADKNWAQAVPHLTITSIR